VRQAMPHMDGPKAGFHHIAFVTKDNKATRHFYEDLLGFPLVHCEAGPGLMHAFFDAGCGSSMAFFSFGAQRSGCCTDLSKSLGVPGWVNRPTFRVSAEQAEEIRLRMEKQGVPLLGNVQHDWCNSMYFMDPNEIVIEICTETRGFVANQDRARLILGSTPGQLEETTVRSGLRDLVQVFGNSKEFLTESKDVAVAKGELKSTSAEAANHMCHLSFASKDLDATRHFYEDLFGFPLVRCDLEQWDNSWVKRAYFDIGSGSCITFFSFENIGEQAPWHTNFDEPLGLPTWANHCAFRATAQETEIVRSRMEQEGIKPIMQMSHGWCSSVYYKDPNGIAVELCVDTPGLEVDSAGAKQMWEETTL